MTDDTKRPTLGWERLGCTGGISGAYVYRASVPGGWLVQVSISEGGGLTFVPDPNHQWGKPRHKQTTL